jgi:hypothetical protein
MCGQCVANVWPLCGRCVAMRGAPPQRRMRGRGVWRTPIYCKKLGGRNATPAPDVWEERLEDADPLQQMGGRNITPAPDVWEERLEDADPLQKWAGGTSPRLGLQRFKREEVWGGRRGGEGALAL